MANLVKFDMKQVPAALGEMFVRVTDLDRNELFAGVKPISGNEIELNLGSVGAAGQGVLVQADNFLKGSNESSFKSFGGYGVIEQFLVDLIYKMSLPLDGDSLPAQSVSPTNIVMLGASNSDGVVSGTSSYMERLFAKRGVNNTNIVDASVGGRHVDEIHASGWLPIKDSYTGDASTYVVLTDTLGNSISGLKPYSTATGASIENVRSELQALIDDIVANGNTPILFETTFRDYDVNGVSSIDDESLSSLPFQQDILYPIVQSMLPAQWSETLSRPWFSLYNHTYNLSKLIHTDGVHHTPVGYELLRRLEVDLLCRFIKGEPSITFDKFTADEANQAVAGPQSVIITESSTSNTGPSRAMPYANYFNINDNNVAVSLVPAHGYNPGSITISSAGGELAHSTNSGFTDDGLDPVDLTNWRIKQAYGYVTHTDKFNLFKLEGFLPNQTVSIGMASYKSDSTESRIAEFTFNTSVTIATNAKPDSSENVVYADVTADENGEIAVTMQKISGYAAHWNGCHVIV
tara:strand:- start:5107 stop:6666 length:1560 start_codon:yes stop_codon:yes gene_type:complete